MILSRRKAHFYMWIGLAGLLPIVFLAGLIWRPTVPTVDEGTDELFAAANFPTADEAAAVTSETVAVNGIDVLLATAESPDSTLVLTVQPTRPLQFSDALVYWTPEESAPEMVGAEAVLLGQLSGTSRRQFPVLPEMQRESGHLLFFSRGQNTVISAIPLPTALFP